MHSFTVAFRSNLLFYFGKARSGGRQEEKEGSMWRYPLFSLMIKQVLVVGPVLHLAQKFNKWKIVTDYLMLTGCFLLVTISVAGAYWSPFFHFFFHIKHCKPEVLVSFPSYPLNFLSVLSRKFSVTSKKLTPSSPQSSKSQSCPSPVSWTHYSNCFWLPLLCAYLVVTKEYTVIRLALWNISGGSACMWRAR